MTSADDVLVWRHRKPDHNLLAIIFQEEEEAAAGSYNFTDYGSGGYTDYDNSTYEFPSVVDGDYEFTERELFIWQHDIK